MKKLAILLALTIAIGCGSGKNEKVVVSNDELLTVDLWSSMKVSKKYEFETLERLREHDPKFKNENHWNRLIKEVVVPQRRKDIPTDY